MHSKLRILLKYPQETDYKLNLRVLKHCKEIYTIKSTHTNELDLNKKIFGFTYFMFFCSIKRV